MKKILLLILLTVFAAFTETRELEILPRIGETYIPDDEKAEAYIPFVIWSQFYCVNDIFVKDIKFRLYTHCEFGRAGKILSSQEIAFIETTDPNFLVPEHVKIGAFLSEIQGEFSYGEECKELPSGWHACVNVQSNDSGLEYGKKIYRFIK